MESAQNIGSLSNNPENRAYGAFLNDPEIELKALKTIKRINHGHQ